MKFFRIQSPNDPKTSYLYAAQSAEAALEDAAVVFEPVEFSLEDLHEVERTALRPLAAKSTDSERRRTLRQNINYLLRDDDDEKHEPFYIGQLTV